MRRELIPDLRQSGSAVRAADFDRDGDLDLLVCGRVVPHQYPLAATSYLLENRLEDGSLQFRDATVSKAPDLSEVGLITDAIWSDVDRDGWLDLLLTGEWSSIRYLKNEQGRLTDRTAGSGLAPYVGWWNSIAAGDIDGDGDTDYVCGNFGENLIYQISEGSPIRIYHGDLDQNGGYDAVLTAYYPGLDGQPVESTVQVRNEVTKQLNHMRSKFLTNDEFGRAALEDILSPAEVARAQVLSANHLASSWIENVGEDRFALHPLPVELQVAPLYSVLLRDLDLDGDLDIIASGNDFGMEITMGKCDAFNGAIVLNQGKDAWHFLPAATSGYLIPGDAKGMTILPQAAEVVLLSAQNQGALLHHTLPFANAELVLFQPGQIALTYRWQGKDFYIERNHDQGFLSQGSGIWAVPEGATELKEIYAKEKAPL